MVLGVIAAPIRTHMLANVKGRFTYTNASNMAVQLTPDSLKPP